MSCAACVRRVEEGLKSIEGVKNATVNFATGKAVVEYDPTAASPDAMAEKVRALGYEVVSREQAGPGAMQKTTVSIGGMTCAACVRRVEMALKDVPGVEEAAVNLATGRGTVTHGTDWAGAGGVRKAVTEAGYEYLGVLDASREDPIEKAREKELRELTVKFVAGIILSVIIFMGTMQEWFPFLGSVPRQAMLYILFALTTPVVFWVGSRFHTGALKALRQKTSDMNTLVSMGALRPISTRRWPPFYRPSSPTRGWVSTSITTGRLSSSASSYWGGSWRRGRRERPPRQSSASWGSSPKRRA